MLTSLVFLQQKKDKKIKKIDESKIEHLKILRDLMKAKNFFRKNLSKFARLAI